jgi:sulfatase maturation enzyme AslB (radical SAM superfamily)
MQQLPSNTFCVLPFIHTVLNPYNSVEHNVNAIPCCRYSHDGAEKLENVDTINKSPTWIKLQEQFLNGEKPEGCEHCWRDEKHGTRSYRHENLFDFRRIIEDNSFLEKKLRYLELVFGNTCNLACRSCSPAFSSKWVIINNNLSKEGVTLSNDIPNVEFSDWRKLDLLHLTQLKIMGGEPFYQKGALELLEYLSELNVLKNINLSIPTNCTIALTDRWKKLLVEAKKVSISISIDAPGKLNNYLREGSVWEELENNLYGFDNFVKQHKNKMIITFNTVLSAYNINKLPEIEKYFNKRFFWKQYSDIAYYPSYMDAALLPEHIKDVVISRGLPDRIKTYLKSKEYSEDNFNQLKRMTEIMDKYHDKNLKDYNKEMYDWIMDGK